MTEATPEKWFFTFCHCHEHPHGYVIFEGSFNEARAKMVQVYGTAWGFQYPIEELAGQIEQFGLYEVPSEEGEE